MLIYIPNNYTRSHYLVANSIQHEYSGTINPFVSKNIYEIAYNTKDSVVIVLNRFDLMDMFIEDFVQSFITQTPKQTKLIILEDSKKILHQNVMYINSSSYKLFNEYYSTEVTDNGYVLCHLDCDDYSNNNTINAIVYPNNKSMKVRLVGCPSIPHIQNLGMVNETQMLDLIAGCSAFVNISDQYVYDAILMNKPTVSIHSNAYLTKIDEITISHIQQAIEQHTPVQHDLKMHKLSNIIKHIIKL